MSNKSNSAMTDEQQQKPVPRPKCQGRKRNHEEKLVGCNAEGFAVWIRGDFGRSPKVLCLGCIKHYRQLGWKVDFQIEGDNVHDATSG